MNHRSLIVCHFILLQNETKTKWNAWNVVIITQLNYNFAHQRISPNGSIFRIPKTNSIRMFIIFCVFAHLGLSNNNNNNSTQIHTQIKNNNKIIYIDICSNTRINRCVNANERVKCHSKDEIRSKQFWTPDRIIEYRCCRQTALEYMYTDVCLEMVLSYFLSASIWYSLFLFDVYLFVFSMVFLPLFLSLSLSLPLPVSLSLSLFHLSL